VTVRQHDAQAPEDWPTAQELQALGASADIVILPDRVDPDPDGTPVAAFREEAQALRVDALGQGLTVRMVVPPGGRSAVYIERAADWVLPVLLAVPLPVVVNLLSNRIQRWIDERGDDAPLPTLHYREARINAGDVRLREIEGPADEVIELLRGEDEAGT
jgi:hypothetical protein